LLGIVEGRPDPANTSDEDEAHRSFLFEMSRVYPQIRSCMNAAVISITRGLRRTCGALVEVLCYLHIAHRCWWSCHLLLLLKMKMNFQGLRPECCPCQGSVEEVHQTIHGKAGTPSNIDRLIALFLHRQSQQSIHRM